jgi:hypothetical protein
MGNVTVIPMGNVTVDSSLSHNTIVLVTVT